MPLKHTQRLFPEICVMPKLITIADWPAMQRLTTFAGMCRLFRSIHLGYEAADNEKDIFADTKLTFIIKKPVVEKTAPVIRIFFEGNLILPIAFSFFRFFGLSFFLQAFGRSPWLLF